MTSNHREKVAPTGIWALETKKSENLSAHIQELEQKLDDRARRVGAVAGVEGAHVDVFIAVTEDTDGGDDHNFTLSQQDVDALHRIGLPVVFTLNLVKK